MKKFAILTSVLALAACGGGSHHAGDRVRVSEQPTYEQPYLLVSDQTRASNAQITGMVSEVSVCENCDSPRPDTGRKATGIEHGNKTFTVYNLQDVKFALVDEDWDPDPEGDFIFVVDGKGEIVGIDLGMRQEINHPEHGPENEKNVDADWVRTGDKFTGYVNTEDGWKTSNITYHSVGKSDNNLNLKYSDFGYFDVDIINNWRPVFIGGYDEVKKIAVNDIINNENTKFTGRATGSVMGRKTIDDYQYVDQKQLPLDGTAELVFNKGTSELTANFDNWYDLKYTETGNNKSIEFSNYKDTPLETKKGEEDKVLTDYYRFISDDTTNKVEFSNVDSDIRYYGDDKVASEAVGIIQVRDAGTNEDEVRMNLSFGVTEVK